MGKDDCYVLISWDVLLVNFSSLCFNVFEPSDVRMPPGVTGDICNFGWFYYQGVIRIYVSFSCVWITAVGVAPISLGVCTGTGTNCQVCISVSVTTQSCMGKDDCYVLISWDVLLVNFSSLCFNVFEPSDVRMPPGVTGDICNFGWFYYQGVIRIYVSFSCVWITAVGVAPISLGVCTGTGTNCQVCISVSVTTQSCMGKDDCYVLISWDVLLVNFSSLCFNVFEPSDVRMPPGVTGDICNFGWFYYQGVIRIYVSFSCVWITAVGVAPISLGVCTGTGTNCQVCISVSVTTQSCMGKDDCYVLISWDVLLVNFSSLCFNVFEPSDVRMPPGVTGDICTFGGFFLPGCHKDLRFVFMCLDNSSWRCPYLSGCLHGHWHKLSSLHQCQCDNPAWYG